MTRRNASRSAVHFVPGFACFCAPRALTHFESLAGDAQQWRTWNSDLPLNSTSFTFKESPCPGHIEDSSVNQPSAVAPIPCRSDTVCQGCNRHKALDEVFVLVHAHLVANSYCNPPSPRRRPSLQDAQRAGRRDQTNTSRMPKSGPRVLDSSAKRVRSVAISILCCWRPPERITDWLAYSVSTRRLPHTEGYALSVLK